MTTLLPLATYSASGSGASFDAGIFRGGVFVLTTTTVTAPSTVTIETSPDGLTWFPVGHFTVAEAGSQTLTLGQLSQWLRASFVGNLVASLDVSPAQIYATLADFASQGLQTGSLEGVTTETIMAALQGASRLIDDYLGARTTLPLVVFASASIARATAVIATYDLLSVIGYNPDGPDENFRLRYLDILRWLEAIRDGRGPLPGGVIGTMPDLFAGQADVYSDCPRGW